MEPVTGLFASWLFGELAGAGSKKVTALVFGSEWERALSRAAAVAIRRTAEEVRPEGGERAEELAGVIDQVFSVPMPGGFLLEHATLLQGLCDGIAQQLAKLADPELTGTGQSAAEVLEVRTDVLSARLASHLLREVMNRGAHGGPLMPLAEQLNHDLTRLQLAGLAGQVTQLVMEALGRHADAGKNPATVTAARSLPGGVPSFTGRRPELERLRRVLQKRTDASSAMRVVAIDGMAGIGKTAFAVHAAHRLASRFPDGQRFLALHGHTPGQLPVSSYDALTALLMADGVAPEQIPADTDARAGLWRAQIAGRKLLLVLDDAVSTEQVRPLLPGTAEALVLITSRRRLTALPATLVLALTILPREEAAQLLVRLSGRSALQPGDSTVVSIAELCGFLPLALSLVAAQLRHHLAWAPGRLAAGLASAADSLPLMAAEDISVAAAFDLSYRNVSDGEQRLFRQLSLHPGTDIDSFAAAALNDTDLTETDTLLNRLFEYHLIEEREQGRYAFHDLIRRHARALAAADPEREHEAAIGRLLNYYLQTARAADIRLAGYTPAGVPAVSGSLPAYAPDLPTRAEASAWMGAERSNLQALVGYAVIHDRPDHAIAITAAMQSFLRSAGYWDQAIASQRAALEAARHTHDQLAEAAVLTDLAVTQRNAADFPAATTGLTKALGLYRELANPLGEANALDELGVVQYLSGDYPAATANLARALELYRAVGDRRGQANTLIGLGAALALSGNYPAAISSLTQARELNRYFVSPLAQADVIYYLGSAQRLIGDYAATIDSQTRALELYRDAGSRNGEANALNELGAAQRLTGNYSAAIDSQTQALKVYRDIGNRLGEASALNELGAVQHAVKDYTEAAAFQGQALKLFREAIARLGEASALNDLGSAQRELKDYAAATTSITQALAIFRELNHRLGEANALIELGALALENSTTAVSRAHYIRALEIAEEIGVEGEQALAHEGIGKSFLNDRQHRQAAEELRSAMNIYRQIGSPGALRVEKMLIDNHL